MKKYLFGATLLAAFVAVAFSAGSAQAGTSTVTGWAWSSNVGWISFNPSNSGAQGGGGGVTVSTTSVADPAAAFGGYAWSPNVGWISFNPGDVSGCPAGFDGSIAPLNGCNPTINFTNGQVTGWAKVLSMNAENANNGWIQLSGQNHPTSGGGGVTLDASTGAFSGYAFEPSSMGWIDFAASTGVDGVCVGSCGGPSNPSSITGTCTASPTAATAGVTPVQFSVSGITGGSGTYTTSYTWNTGVGAYAGNSPYTFTYPSNTVSAPYSTGVTVTDNTGATGVISCPTVTVSGGNAGRITLLIGHSAPTANSASLTVHQGDPFGLSWVNNLPATYVCSPTVTGTGGNSANWPTWNTTIVSTGNGQLDSLSTSGDAVGTYHFNLNCSDTGPSGGNNQNVQTTLIIQSSTIQEI